MGMAERMTQYKIDPEKFEAIFGKQQEDRSVGRSRLCKTCGGWHAVGQVPHNCRPPQGPRQHLAAPRIAPAFDPYLASPGSDVDEVIGSRNEKREFMKRNDLVEYDEGVGKKNEWARQNDEIADIVDDIKMVEEMDPDRRRVEFGATQMVEGGSLAEGTEIEIGTDE